MAGGNLTIQIKMANDLRRGDVDADHRRICRIGQFLHRVGSNRPEYTADGRTDPSRDIDTTAESRLHRGNPKIDTDS